MKGKDGKTFDLSRWVEWAVSGSRPSMKLEVSKTRYRRKRNPWVCPNCFNVFNTVNIKSHKEACHAE